MVVEYGWADRDSWAGDEVHAELRPIGKAPMIHLASAFLAEAEAEWII
jgi:hypothetical protein